MQKRLTFFVVAISAIVLGVFSAFLARPATVSDLTPPPTPAPPPNPEPPEITLLFAGDVMLDRVVKQQIEKEQDPLYPFLRIAETTQSADMFFINLEGPISDRGLNQGSKYSFRFEPAGTINALKYAGVDVVNLANNHIWDYGRQALVDTLDYLQGLSSAHIYTIGAGRIEEEANAPAIVLFPNSDLRVALLGYTTLYPKSLEATAERPGISHFEIEVVKAQIQEIKAKKSADIVIVSLHWGEEYQSRSNAQQQAIAHALVDAGADLIIGHHPHVAQEVEEYSDKYIAYSLGNFIFDQDFSKATMQGLMLKATVKNKKISFVEQIPIYLTPTFQPYVGDIMEE